MKALTLSAENQKKLLTLLPLLFPGFKRIEIENYNSGTLVIFSKVGSGHPLNFVWRKLVNSEIPLLELFMREIPEALSDFGNGNKSFSPYYHLQISLLCRSTGDNLVRFLDETMQGMTRPLSQDDYSVVKRKIDNISGRDEAEKVAHIMKTSSDLLGTKNLGLLDLYIVTE